MKSFICELILSCVIAAPVGKPIDELTYGSMLYSYYQNDYPTALVEAMVAEVQGRRGEAPVRFDLATGSFAFNDGMYELARQTFASVAAEELTALDKMRLAFHLAREHHRRGDYAGVAYQLEQVELGRSWLGRKRFHPEVEFMRAELSMASGDSAAAERYLDRLGKDDPFFAYGHFNLGVSYRRQNDLDGARQAFERIAALKATDPETLDLVQRSKLALAFIARASSDPASAAEVLGALPGEGRYRDIALASYGALAMEQQDYELAARIWLTLQNQAYWTSSTAQARLGFPLSLERLASEEMALVQYREAERSFENRLAALTTLTAQAEDPDWVHGLLLVFSTPERDEQRMNDLVERWRAQLGHTDWLEWLAAEDTHEVLLEWRELVGMREWLDRLPAKLGAFDEVAGEQRRRGAMAKDLLHDQQLLSNRQALEAQSFEQADAIALLKTSDPERSAVWMAILAEDEERTLIEDLSAMRGLVDRGMTDKEADRWLARIDRLEGVLFWQIVDQGAVRIRKLEKQLTENLAVLADIDERIARVQNAEAQFVAGVETDFLDLADRADMLSNDVDLALNQREVALAGQLRRGMAREMQEVQKYLLVTRIGIARATDQLSMAGSGETMEGE